MGSLHRFWRCLLPHSFPILVFVTINLMILSIEQVTESSSSISDLKSPAGYDLTIKKFNKSVDITGLAKAEQFDELAGSYFNLGSKSFGWVKIALTEGVLPTSGKMLINIKRNNIFTPVYLHFFDGNIWHKRPFRGSDDSQKDLVIVLPSNIESSNVYVQLSGHYLRGNVRVMKESDYIKQTKKDSVVDGLYFGFLGLFIFFNLAIFVVFNRKSHLSYALLLVVTFIWLATGQGWTTFFLPQMSHVSVFTANSFGILFSFAMALFTRHFLQLKVISPTINKTLIYNQRIALTMWFLYLLTYQSLPHLVHQLGYGLSHLNTLMILVSSIFAALVAIQRGRQNAKYYLLVMVILITVAISMSLSAAGIMHIPFSWRTLQLASVLEISILSIGFIVEYYQKHREMEKIEGQLKIVEAEFAEFKIDSQSFKDKLSSNLVDHNLIPELAKILTIIPQLYFIKANGNYSVAYYVNDGVLVEIFVDCNLQSLLESIGELALLRCHKSYLINTKQKYQLLRRTTADYDLVIEQNRIPVGRKYLSTVRKHF